MESITLLECVGQLDSVRVVAHGVEPVEQCRLLGLRTQRMSAVLKARLRMSTAAALTATRACCKHQCQAGKEATTLSQVWNAGLWGLTANI